MIPNSGLYVFAFLTKGSQMGPTARHWPPLGAFQLSFQQLTHVTCSRLSTHMSCPLVYTAGISCFRNPKGSVKGRYATHVEAYRIFSFMSSSLLFRQCPACLLRLTWVLCEIGSEWWNSFSFVRICFKNLFKTVRSILR